MKGLKGLAVRFHTKQFSGRMFRFVTGTYLGGQASDVILKAAISRVPGDLTSANGCRVKTVSNDAGMTRSFSEIKMVVDAGEPAADATDRQRQAARTNLGYVNKGQACAVESDSEYFYNIAGDCDWASIEHQNSMGWDNKGPANGCPISLANNGILELGPGYVHKPYVKSDKPKYNGLTAAEEKEYQKWLASLPDNVRLVILSGSTQGRYQWWKELGGGK
ncbi:MAG: hypothetical protein M0D55_09920 [Elusimicrobiota bacterium]|nr:MAG: hypothetical protein M0D55_09920 [Elusimicrobiota bacterium]